MPKLSRFRKAAHTALIAFPLVVAGCTGRQLGVLPAPANVAHDIRPASAVVNPGIPMHVQNFTFWRQGSLAENVPASWMATWADWAEISTSQNANAFHAAGGKHTVVYTNPNYYYVLPTYTSPGTYPESAFGHGSSGVRTQWDGLYGGTEYYLLPNSSASQTGYGGVIAKETVNGGYDFVYADGVSDSLATSLWGQRLPIPTEITTNAQYVTGMEQLMAVSPLPTIINGYNNGNPVTEEEYIGAPNIKAIFGEECFTEASRVQTNQYWIDQENALLDTTAHGLYAICGGRGALADTRPERIYYLASWWLSYDPTYSVSLAEFSSYATVYVFPEQALVPTRPDQVETTISAIKWYTGVYIRRFEACYYMQVSWGPCAAIVNPSSTSNANIPQLPVTYHHSLALDANNLYEGGTASLSTSVPTSLAPGSAVILFQ
jgi:hypothetical protein